ncbi:MAG: acyltransferase, partial [Oscillospiraceae bacterium]
MEGFYSPEELKEFGFKHVGNNVLISKKASIYGAKNMSFGDNVRIDDFCMLVGSITLGNNIHIAAFCGLHASCGSISVDDYSTFSSNVTVYAASDDYSGEYMTSSVIPEKYKNTIKSDITVGKYVIVGTGCSILVGATIADGVAVGAMSLVQCELQEWGIYAGIPCKRIKERSKKLIELKKGFEEE